MKKILYSLFAAATVLLVAGCQKETEKVWNGKTVEATFEIQFDDLTTKAFADGQSVNELYVGVYDAKTGELYSKVSASKPVSIINGSASYSTPLLKGKSYTVAFWAQKSGNKLYTVDLEKKTVTANYSAVATGSSYDTVLAKMQDGSTLPCSVDDYDAFYSIVTLDNLDETVSMGVSLHRPLAQINLLTPESDITSAQQIGYTPDAAAIAVDGVKDTFSLVNGTLDGTEKEVQMMHRRDQFFVRYAKAASFDLAALDFGQYRHRNYSMVFGLPHEGVSLGACLKGLDATTWNEAVSSLSTV